MPCSKLGVVGQAPTTTTIKGQPCVNVVVVSHTECVPGYPHYDFEGMECGNEGQVDEAYCSYTVGANACAYCNPSGEARKVFFVATSAHVFGYY